MLDSAEIDWPAMGSAALSLGNAVASSEDADVARPMASLTKIVTALVILDAAPLPPGAQGPMFRMDETDAGFAQAEAERVGRYVPVSPGDVLTQRQLLELMLVASSNNHATSLVTRIFGNERAYVAAAQRWLDERDLHGVRIADASGLSPANRASALDLLMIGRLAAADPTITEIAALPATRAVPGREQPATNDLLGTLGITGLKTGYTDAAGHTTLFVTSIGDEQLVGVVLGSPSATQRATDVTRLVAQLRSLVAG